MKAQGERLIDQLRLDILDGQWAPGSKLLPDELAAQYQTSKTVVREALTGLVGMGLITLEPNRGFFAQVPSLRELRALTELRCHADSLALRLSIENGGEEWEGAVAAAHFQLQRAHRRTAEDPRHLDPTWSHYHRQFHQALVEACEVPALIGVSRQLADATQLYRHWSAESTSESDRDVEGEHQAIFDAVMDHDADRAGRLLREHYERTLAVLETADSLRLDQAERTPVPRQS